MSIKLCKNVGRRRDFERPSPLDTALNYAGQIADALEAAHEKGMTHRDLKPANIMIKPDGVAKGAPFRIGANGATKRRIGQSDEFADADHAPRRPA